MKKLWVAYSQESNEEEPVAGDAGLPKPVWADEIVFKEPDKKLWPNSLCITIDNPAQEELFQYLYDMEEGTDGYGFFPTIRNIVDVINNNVPFDKTNKDLAFCVYESDGKKLVKVFRVCVGAPPADVGGIPVEVSYGICLADYICTRAVLQYPAISETMLFLLGTIATAVLQAKKITVNPPA